MFEFIIGVIFAKLFLTSDKKIKLTPKQKKELENYLKSVSPTGSTAPSGSTGQTY